MAGRIRVLDEATVNKIAAGEVVDRPASVVKELVENALDAGASSVLVAVEDGGRRSVLVRDDGCGMPREDAGLAFERHATSKISTIEDLQKLSSYGFRGEALSSVAAVSKVALRTREHGSGEGTEVIIEGGKVSRVSPTGCPPGTEIEVRDIFYNVPARMKSLKSKNVELAHCREVMMNYIICRPGLAWKFMADGEVELAHSPAEGMQGSLVSAFGPKVANGMMFGEGDGDGVRVEAYLGRLEHTRSSLADLRLFVNDRPVRNSRLSSAVITSYGSRLMKDRYPVGVVRLFLDPSAVDFNVHPSKREVRFDDEGKVAGAVQRAVEKALSGRELTFRYDLTKFAEGFEPVTVVSSEEAVKAVQSTLSAAETGERTLVQPAIVPLAQIMNTYILAESAGNLLLMDQHAASERVVYEKLLQSIKSGRDVSQRLLTPLVINLTAVESRVLEENRSVLESAGFAAEPFGQGAYALRSIPTVLGVSQGEYSLRNLLGDLGRMAPQKKLGLEVIWRVACHTAIRAGEPLSHGRMRSLISELLRTKSPYTCEHGRPTMIVLSPSDLEKLFKRRV